MAAEDEVEWLDLLGVRLAVVERGERFEHLGLLTVIRPTATRFSKPSGFAGRPSDRRTIASHACGDPVAIVALRIGGIEQMPEAMLGVPILFVVHAFAQQRRLPDWIANEERIPLGGNRQAPELPLLAGLGIEVVVLDLENRAGDRGAIVGIERSNRCAIASTCAQDNARIAGLPFLRYGPPGHSIRPPRCVATIAMESVSSIAYVPPRSVTQRSSSASISRAAAVISDASGGKQYSPGFSGLAPALKRLWVDAVARYGHFFADSSRHHLGKDAVTRRIGQHFERFLEPLPLFVGKRRVGSESLALFDHAAKEVLRPRINRHGAAQHDRPQARKLSLRPIGTRPRS